MQNYKITTIDQYKDFSNRLDSYWMETCNNSIGVEEIFSYYKVDENYPDIDNPRNHYKALSLALTNHHYDFVDFLTNSDKIKNRKYSLYDIAETIKKDRHLNPECVLALLDAFENKKEIFDDIKLKAKKNFIEACTFHFVTSTFLDDKSNTENHEFLFRFLKKYKVNPYENQFNMLGHLFTMRAWETLDLLISRAKKNEDKEKIIYFEFDPDDTSITLEIKELLALRCKQYEITQEYKKLKNEVNKEGSQKTKRMKI